MGKIFGMSYMRREQHKAAQKKAEFEKFAENFLTRLEGKLAEARVALHSDDPTELQFAILDIRNVVNDSREGISEDALGW